MADPDELIVPYEERSTEFMLVAVFQSHPATIPCKATNSMAKVSLWKMSSKPEEIVVNNTLGISFNPKKGYHFEYPRWDADNMILECRVELNSNTQYSQIHIHWSGESNLGHLLLIDIDYSYLNVIQFYFSKTLALKLSL